SDADQKRAGKAIGKAIAIEKRVAEIAAQVKSGAANNTALEAKQRELADTLLDLFIVMDNNGATNEAQTRVVYAALGDARRRVLSDREAAATIPKSDDDDFQMKYDRLLRAAAAAYD